MVKEQNINMTNQIKDHDGYENSSGRKKAMIKKEIAKKMKKYKDGTDIPKSKWGARQGNFMKVHPLDR